MSDSLLSAEDLHCIQQQLGRPPRGIVKVAWRHPDGTPAVLQMRSLVDDQPFPTLYWLSCPRLYKAIAGLETAGLVKLLEAELATDDSFRQAYLANQQQYVAKRWAEMAESDRQRIEQLGFSELFNRYGIGGISQWDKIRCLHMQYAHYLVDGNVVGERVEMILNCKE